jgi:hypothetical protein
MRILSNYRANPNDASEPLVLMSVDSTDIYGLNHRYLVVERADIPAMSFATNVLPPMKYNAMARKASTRIQFQIDGPSAKINPNKANSDTTDLMVIGAVLDHLTARQAAPSLASDQQATAITHLQLALTALQQRP